MNAAARNVVPISPVGNSAIDAPAATLRSDGTLVQRVEQIPEMAAVDLSVLRAAFHLLMKVGEDQKVMKREALMTAQQIRLAMENNVLRMVPVTDEQRTRLEGGETADVDSVIEQFRDAEQAHD